MKFASRDGSAARTFAYTSVPPSPRPATPAKGWYAMGASPAPSPRVVETQTRGRIDEAGRAGTTPRRTGAAGTTVFLRGQQVFAPGHGQGLVYIVRSGCIRLYKTLPEGRTINVGLLGPNTVFTQEDSSDGLASGATAEALVDSTLSVVATDDLASIIADSPELAAAMVTGMSRRTTELQTLVAHLLVRDTSIRLATTLLSLATLFGRPTADGLVAIALPLTHQRLAGMIGSNRVTVTRKLLDLQEGGYIRSRGRNAIAVDADRLREYVQKAGEARDDENR